ncbi:MAG TPA: hypothetical protein VF275_03445 [Gammaproteobacteria bacterium]
MNQSTALEKVKQWANPDATVSTFEAVSVPGMSLFSFTPSPSDSVFMHDFTPPRWGVLIRHDDAAILSGKDGMKAALDAGVSDPEEIARLALLFLHDHGEFADDAEPPFFQRESLIYYWRRNDMNRQLMKAQLDRDALTVVIEPVVEVNGSVR